MAGAAVGLPLLSVIGCDAVSGIVDPTLNTFPKRAVIPNFAVLQSRQRNFAWCWAACAETLIKYYGVRVTDKYGRPFAQEYFVQKVYGAIVDQPATLQQLAYALTDQYPRGDGAGYFNLTGYFEPGMPTPQSTLRARYQLSRGVPFIVLIYPAGGSQVGHYLTIYGMDWVEDSAGNVLEVKGLYASDPFAGLYQQYAPNVQPPPQYLDSSINNRYVFEGAVWAE
ncbi:MAG: hypothetical protein NVS3B9_3700 [Candidatus Doudnabacteria bacterium]